MTYRELGEKVKQIGSALAKTKHIANKTIFNIYSNTSLRWQMMALGCASQSITFCTAYDSLGEEGVSTLLSFYIFCKKVNNY